MPTVDWERIRAEYIAGGASIRNLADKYGISKDAVGRRAKAEKWKETRDKTATKVRQRTNERIVAQKADEAANNAVIAARIRSSERRAQRTSSSLRRVVEDARSCRSTGGFAI